MILTQLKIIARRKSKGSMTFLVTLLTGIFVVVALCGIAFNFMLFLRARAQYEADARTLDFATKLNMADRVGGVNLLEEASREIVFVSRQNCNRCADLDLPQLNALSNLLLERARQGHSLIECERQNQIAAICKEAQAAARHYNKEKSGKSSLSFFDLNYLEPEILRVDLGCISAVDSSVRDLNVIPELSEHDISKGYVNQKSRLYRSGLNVKLPDPDSDLDFYFSSLPAYTKNTTSPSRNTNDAVFASYGTVFTNKQTKETLPKQIPSAVHVVYVMSVTVPWDHSGKSSIELSSTGTTSGASADSN